MTPDGSHEAAAPGPQGGARRQELESWLGRWEQLPGPVLGPSQPPTHTQSRETWDGVSPFVNLSLRGLLSQPPVCGQEARGLVGSALQPHPDS